MTTQIFDPEEYMIGILLCSEYDHHRYRIIKEIKPEWIAGMDIRVAFNAVKDLVIAGEPISLQAVCSRIRGRAREHYIAECLGSIINDDGVSCMVEDIRKQGIKRELQSAAVRMIDKCTTSADMIRELNEWVVALLPEENTSEIKGMEELSNEYFEVLTDRILNDSFTGIKTGLYGLDNMLGGFHKGNLIILAGRPSMGKTALVMTFFYNMINRGKVPLFVSLEMSTEELIQRFVSIETKLPSDKIRKGEIDTDDQKLILTALEAIKLKKAFITDKVDPDIMQFKNAIIRFKRSNPFDILVVDYLQLMSAKGKADENRVAEISKISRELKNLARILDVPIIVLAQLNRGCESRNPPVPRMSDLRDSGSIEQDADVVALIYRPKYYGFSEEDVTQIMVDKNRHGATGQIDLEFQPHTMRFTDKARY